MFTALKRKLEEKKRWNKAAAQSQHWKNDQLVQSCLQSMRGGCTVASAQLHEALVAVVNIALLENSWTPAPQIPLSFLPETAYIVWNDDRLPMLTASTPLLLENLDVITAVADETFLVSETMDRVIHMTSGGIYIYDLTVQS